MRIAAAVNLVPREQHLCLFASLHALREELDVCVLVGDRFRSPVADFLYEQLDSVIMCEGALPSGMARRKLLEVVAGVTRGRCLDWVLFLDDDCSLSQRGLEQLCQRCGLGTGCMGLQSDYVGRTELLRGRPAFDLFCTLMPARYIEAAVEDRHLLDLLGRMSKGGEFLMLDWYFRWQGCFFNICTESVLHIFIQDDYKVWGHRPQRRWDEIADGICVCQSLNEVEAFLAGEGLLD